jgi:hypothetical protein
LNKRLYSMREITQRNVPSSKSISTREFGSTSSSSAPLGVDELSVSPSISAAK